MINIKDLTLGQLDELRALLGQPTTLAKPHPYEIGKAHFVRTVTHHFTGILREVYDEELFFDHCAWIADDGRFSDAVKTGNFNEVEPYPQNDRVIIGRGSLIDCKTVDFIPPSSQK